MKLGARSRVPVLAAAVALAGWGMGGCGPAPAGLPPTAAPHLTPLAGQTASPASPVGPQPSGPAGGGGGVTVDLSNSPTAAPPTVGIPDRVDIPAIGVHAPVQILGRNPDGSRQVPDQFDTVGWYSDTPRPGDVGPAVLAGHVDSYRGAAVFFHLDQLHPGDVVTVSSSTGVRRFQVTSVALYPKDRFPTDLVFGPVPDTELRLVTCGGSFDRAARSYVDNVVVFLTGQ